MALTSCFIIEMRKIGQRPELCCRSGGLQIFRGRLAGPAVRNNVERDLLPLFKIVHACAFYRSDMNEDIFASVIRLNKTEAFLIIRPHPVPVFMGYSFAYVCIPRHCAALKFEISWGEVVSQARCVREAKSFGRSSI